MGDVSAEIGYREYWNGGVMEGGDERKGMG